MSRPDRERNAGIDRHGDGAAGSSGAGAGAANDERERLLAALAELAFERGYRHTSVATLTARAGLAEAAFARHFASKDDCLVAAFDATAGQGFSVAAEAFMSTPGSWANAAHAALRAFFQYLADNPQLAHLATVELPHAGQRGIEHRQRALELFSEFLQPGFQQLPDLPCNPDVLSKMIAGGIYEAVRIHASQRRVERLPDALPTLALIMLGPFLERSEALQIAGVSPGDAR